MNRTALVAAIFIVGIIVVASVYGGHNLFNSSTSPSSIPQPNLMSPTATPTPSLTASPAATPSPSPSSASSNTTHSLHLPQYSQEPTNITVVDAKGRPVTITLPVARIISLNPGLTELLCALGGENKIVGRDENSLFPASILEKLVVGGSSYTPNVELIIDLKPDLLVADTMLYSKTVELEKIQSAGIPVVLESPSNYTRLPDVIKYLSLILGTSEKATDIINFMEYYENLVKVRVGKLAESEKPKVYIEWNRAWLSFANGSTSHEILVKAGGVNIAAGASVSSPTLSPEFVTEKNPDVIIRMAGHGLSLAEFQALRNELLTRQGLSSINAVTKGRVRLYASIIFQGIRYPVGLLYWAKWFHPNLFQDIDPASVHAQLIQRFFGVTLEGVYAYP